MWDGFFMLLALSTIMGAASFLAGILPLSFSLTPRQLRILTLLGAGVLVGTSLIVIIPEGIETMYSATSKSSTRMPQKAIQPTIPSVSTLQNGARRPADFPTWKRADEVNKLPIDVQVKKTKDTKDKDKNKANLEAEDGHPQKGGDDDSTEGHKEGHTRVHAPEEDDHHAGADHEEGSSPHAFIGVALILGYILMFLVDHVPETISSSKPKYQPMHISLSNLHRGPHNASSLSLNGIASEAVTPLATPMPPHMAPKKTSATTVGLIVHACADGIALGASSTAPSTSLSLVIFFAIMLHKAPAAFGLTSVLLKQGLSKKTTRKHLAFFSLAAPVGAVVTWAFVHTFGRGRLGGDEGLAWSTGWVLCFSGGTFLYVAMHSMAEATSTNGHDDPTANGYMDAYPGKKTLSKVDIGVVLFGMLFPLVTQIGHAHAH
ncbi:ZIP zinc transporter-domain-containing protein [Phaeosphaeriaceae sp. PMI808]|nr:ZIP zinc transporter-domain-containing protein [Phaeosphaeriaceae sp. PMI808]